MEKVKNEFFKQYCESRKREQEFNQEVLETARFYNKKIRECNEEEKIKKYEKVKEGSIRIDEKRAYAEREVQTRLIELYSVISNENKWFLELEFEEKYENLK